MRLKNTDRQLVGGKVSLRKLRSDVLDFPGKEIDGVRV